MDYELTSAKFIINLEKNHCSWTFDNMFEYTKISICKNFPTGYEEECATYEPPIPYYDYEMIPKCHGTPDLPECQDYVPPISYEEFLEIRR